MPSLTVKLDLAERDSLFELAKREGRDPRAQAALIIRRALARRKLLTVTPPSAQPVTLPAQPSDLRDWLKSIGAASTGGEPPTEGELPDWLKTVDRGIGNNDATR